MASPSALKIGAPFPDGDVVVMVGKTRKVVKMSSQLSGKDVILFIPAAFARVCSEEHLPSFDTDEWRKSGYKIHCISTDTITVLEKWRDDYIDLQINMISNCKRTFCKELLIDYETLGVIFKRGSAVVENGLLKYLNVEKKIYDCEASSGTCTLKQINGV